MRDLSAACLEEEGAASFFPEVSKMEFHQLTKQQRQAVAQAAARLRPDQRDSLTKFCRDVLRGRHEVSDGDVNVLILDALAHLDFRERALA